MEIESIDDKNLSEQIAYSEHTQTTTVASQTDFEVMQAYNKSNKSGDLNADFKQDQGIPEAQHETTLSYQKAGGFDLVISSINGNNITEVLVCDASRCYRVRCFRRFQTQRYTDDAKEGWDCCELTSAISFEEDWIKWLPEQDQIDLLREIYLYSYRESIQQSALQSYFKPQSEYENSAIPNSHARIKINLFRKYFDEESKEGKILFLTPSKITFQKLIHVFEQAKQPFGFALIRGTNQALSEETVDCDLHLPVTEKAYLETQSLQNVSIELLVFIDEEEVMNDIVETTTTQIVIHFFF